MNYNENGICKFAIEQRHFSRIKPLKLLVAPANEIEVLS